MKKISLINTLKKTFKKKKSVNKKRTLKSPPKQKKTIVNTKPKKVKIEKKQKKNSIQRKIIKSKSVKAERKNNSETNSNLLRIPKSNEQKPEIKKVKKQDTEKKGLTFGILLHMMQPSGGVPERSKGSDCKSDGLAFAGSNPAPSTSFEE